MLFICRVWTRLDMFNSAVVELDVAFDLLVIISYLPKFVCILLKCKKKEVMETLVFSRKLNGKY